MESSELIGLISTGPNAALVAAISGDPTWNVHDDWGLGSHWKVGRVPVGIKFRRSTNGLVSEEVVVARVNSRERATHEKLSALSRVPMHLVLLERPHASHNRLTRYFPDQGIAGDS